MGIKIAIVGATSSGKSTLIKELKKKTDIPIIEEVARKEIEKLGKSPLELSPEEQLKFQMNLLEKQIEVENNYKDFITDRSVIDILTYFYYFGLHYKFPDKFIDSYNRIYKHISSYSVIVYIPLTKEIPFVKDGVRYECEFCRNLLDALLFQILFNCRYFPVAIYTLDRVDLQERVNFILDLIDYYKIRI